MNKTYADVYKNNKLNIFVDISTYCNAGCPQCHRTDPESGGLRKTEWLPLIRWDLEEFKSAYTEELVKATAIWEICGTWGDPVMCKDMYEIAQYILTVNPYTILTIDSNGSIRPLSWWKKLGELSNLCKGGGVIRVDFAIEGITQEMHSKYRKFTDLNKILANMKAFTDAGGEAKAFCVVHKHNQDYLQQIMDMCKAYGAYGIDYVENNRFNIGNKFKFVNEENEVEYLEQAEEGYYSPKLVRGAQVDWKTRQQFVPEWLKKLHQEVSQVGEEEDIH